MQHVFSLRTRRPAPHRDRAGETCEVHTEHLATPDVAGDHHWWRFVVRPGGLVSPTFLADRDPTAPAPLHPRRDHPAAQVAFASLLTDCMRAGWMPEPRGAYWFNARFRRPRPVTRALWLTPRLRPTWHRGPGQDRAHALPRAGRQMPQEPPQPGRTGTRIGRNRAVAAGGGLV